MATRRGMLVVRKVVTAPKEGRSTKMSWCHGVMALSCSPQALAFGGIVVSSLNNLPKYTKKINKRQREAAEISGGGISAFSRYENGKTKPLLALVKLFKLLNRPPDLLNEVKTA